MITKFFSLISVTFISLFAIAQNHTGTNGDMRNFASQTQVTFNRNPFDQKKNTIGTQYLFDTWVHGSVTNISGISFSDGLFNFDKINQNLYMKTVDTTVAFLVDKQELKSISLSDGTRSYLLEKIPFFKNNQFYNALVKGNKYSLYSLSKTKFVAANYQTNGIVSSGKMYDEYKDEITYYIISADGTAKEIALKKKAVKSVFENEKKNLDNFFKNNSTTSINEEFLIVLITFLNQ